MGYGRSSKSLSVTVAATTVAVVAAGFTGVEQAAAAPEGEPAAGIQTSKHSLDGVGTSGARPRGALPRKGQQTFLLQLSTKSTQSVFQSRLRVGSRAAAKTAARNQLDVVRASQTRVAAALPAGTRVLYRTHAAVNGIAVRADASKLAALRGTPGVTAVYPVSAKKTSNSYAVPFVGADAAWQFFGNTGENTTIAIIDTGLDYTHSNFGGPGSAEIYDAQHADEELPADPALFPNDKVIGGFDFAGDSYDGDNEPLPDPNPLDCNGHGSHVGGTAAGYGVNADGSTYDGPYNESTPFDDLRIGPGVAPEAKLYAYRVFGCEGSSFVVGQAMDRSMDPNGDGDPSDRVDVVNMSLGEDFGSRMDGDSVLADQLVAAGVNVVVASGNGGDVFDVGGSPGNAVGTIAVANSVDAQSVVDALHVTAPPAIAGDYAALRSVAYDWATEPDISGTVVALNDPANPDGCLPFSPADQALVAGKIAFLEWDDDDNTRRCGSAGRSLNARNAGAAGAVLASNAESFSAGISGDTEIPVVITAKSGSDAMRDHLAEGVEIDGTTPNGFTQFFPEDDDLLNGGSSRGQRQAGAVKPDVTAVGTSLFSTGVGTGDEGANNTGTSMATPMVAGLAALVTENHPNWTPQEIKADIMNTANHDLFTDPGQAGDIHGPNRVGTGRIDAVQAMANDVVAYVVEDPGAVSVSFGPLEVTEDMSLTKTIKVANKSLSSVTYEPEYEAITTIPGVSYEVSPESVTIDPRSSKTVEVTVDIVADELTKPIDPTMSRTQLGLPREYVADASGRVLLHPTSDRPTLRVPVYSSPRPASQMSASSPVTLPSGSIQTGVLGLSGEAVDQGADEDNVTSLVAGFELQAEDGQDPVSNSDERSADLRYVGVTSDAPQLESVEVDPLESGFVYFALSTHGPWYTPSSQQEFDIYIDTTGDEVPDFVTFNTRIFSGADGQDIFVTDTWSLDENGALDENVDIQLINQRFGDTDTALFDSDTLVMPVAIGALGLTESSSRISYAIASFSNQQGPPVDLVGWAPDETHVDGSLTIDTLRPGVAVFGSVTEEDNPILFQDAPGTTLQVRRDRDAYNQGPKLGSALIVHFHNEVGEKAQKVQLKSTRVASDVTLTVTPKTVAAGKTVTAKVAVANTENTVPTGLVYVRRAGYQTKLAQGTLGPDGSVTLKFRPTRGGGPWFLQAVYPGDTTYAQGISDNVTLNITKVTGEVRLALSPNPVEAGRKVTATVRVTRVNGLPPSGRVRIETLSGRRLGAGTVTNGKATITFDAPAARGSYRVRAEYAGNGAYKAANSVARTLKVV